MDQDNPSGLSDVELGYLETLIFTGRISREGDAAADAEPLPARICPFCSKIARPWDVKCSNCCKSLPCRP